MRIGVDRDGIGLGIVFGPVALFGQGLEHHFRRLLLHAVGGEGLAHEGAHGVPPLRVFHFNRRI